MINYLVAVFILMSILGLAFWFQRKFIDEQHKRETFEKVADLNRLSHEIEKKENANTASNLERLRKFLRRTRNP